MANNYDQSTMSPKIPLTPDQVAALDSLRAFCFEGEEDPDIPLTDLAKKWMAEFEISEDDIWPDREAEPGSDVHYLYYEDGSLTPGTSSVLQEILRGLDPVEYPHLAWEGAYTCSKLRPGEFGGWACFITRDEIQWHSTFEWLEKKAKEAESLRPKLDLDLDELQKKHGGYWGDHPAHLPEDWIAAVVNEDTRNGYWEWVEARIIDEGGDK